MRIAFKRLFGIRVRHGWYPDGSTAGDFDVVPSPSTAVLLDELGLRVRRHGDGVTVFGEVIPDSAPPVLRRPLGAISFRFAFELRARNTALLAITDLPAYHPARTIFSFDNLREEIVSSRPLLGDRVAGARIGAPVTLVTGGAYLHQLGAASAAALVTVRDRFARVVATIEARSPDPAVPMTQVRLEPAAIAAMVPGRYDITDDHGGASGIYYDPGLAESRPAGVIEIYLRTDGLTPDATDRVPAPYRFITAAGAVAGIAPYYLQLEPLATTWRYRITKQYTSNPVALDQLIISGPVPFTGSVSGDHAIFTSDSTMRLSAAPRGVQLLKRAAAVGDPDDPVRDLPHPDLTTPLGAVAALPNFVSDMFVSV